MSSFLRARIRCTPYAAGLKGARPSKATLHQTFDHYKILMRRVSSAAKGRQTLSSMWQCATRPHQLETLER